MLNNFYKILFTALCAVTVFSLNPKLALAQQTLPACVDLATNTVCGGQKAYDTCTETIENGIKYMNCVASQNSNCTGKIECSQPVAAPVNQPKSCNDVKKQYVCSGGPQLAYDNCVEKWDANGKARFECVSTENPNCVGTLLCASDDRRAATPTTPSGASGGNVVAYGGTASVNISGGVGNSSGTTTIIREVPISIATSTCPAGTTKSVKDQQIVCIMNNNNVSTTVAGVKELPRTGLPIAVWAAAAFIPMGFKLRKFASSVKSKVSNASAIWQDRNFKI